MNAINRPFLLFIVYILLILLEIFFSTNYVSLFGPIVLFVYIIYVFWGYISSADFNLLFKNKETWKTIYTYTLWSVIIQGAANKLLQLVLGFEPFPITQYMLALTPLVAIICSPVIEEVIFRKLIFGYLNSKVGFWFASITSSILFALGHANYAGWLGFFLIGMFWSWIYKKTGNIMITIILHMSLNTIALIVMSIKGSAF